MNERGNTTWRRVGRAVTAGLLGRTALVRRRRFGVAITAMAVAMLAAAAWWVTQRLGHASYLTGATTWACLVLLLMLGMRRRVPMLPLLSMSTWTQIHIYTGLFATAAYLLHVPAVLATGKLEGALSWLFLGCSASGLYGLYASRTAPKKLAAVRGQYRFEQIRWHRSRIAEMAEGLLEQLGGTQAATVLARFYVDALQPFFLGRPGLAYVTRPSGTRRRRLLHQLGELDRYLESDTRRAAGRFAALVRLRDDLDYHFALQLRLRVWLVVHGILSLALIVAATAHALLVIRFVQ